MNYNTSVPRRQTPIKTHEFAKCKAPQVLHRERTRSRNLTCKTYGTSVSTQQMTSLTGIESQIASA